MLFDRFLNFQPQDFVFKIASTPSDREGFHALRRRIFCDEQGIFQEDDRDGIDEYMIPIINSAINK